MKLLITGGCGLLGRAIVTACEGRHEVIVLDRVDEAIALGGVKGDIADLEAVLDAAHGCDAIIHTAALHGGQLKSADTSAFIRTNVIGADNIFQTALRRNIQRVVVASSLEVLVGLNWDASGMTVLDESSPLRPDWIYPVTKQQVEILGSFYSRAHGLQIAQLRYVGIEDRPLTDIGYDLLNRVITPHDAATATLAALEKPNLRDEIFMIGPDSPLDQSDINEALAGHTWSVLERHWPGCQDVLGPRLGKPHSDHFWPVTRINRAALMLGWKPRQSFETLLHSLGWKRNATIQAIRVPSM